MKSDRGIFGGKLVYIDSQGAPLSRRSETTAEPVRRRDYADHPAGAVE
jgi:hypothetical protein